MSATLLLTVLLAHMVIVTVQVHECFIEELNATAGLSNRGDRLKRLQEIRNAMDAWRANKRSELFDLTRWRPQPCLPERKP